MRSALAGLPDEVLKEIAPHTDGEGENSRLDSLSAAVSGRRDEAKAARKNSGIEALWTYCEEAYVGVDDANRNEFKDAKWSKPMAINGPVTTDARAPGTDHKSTVFIRLTARYVDAGAAKLGEILLPADDKAFSFTETPVPDLIKAKEDTSQVLHDGMGNAPLMRPARPGETVPEQKPATVPSGSLPSSLSGAMAAHAQQPPAPAQDMRAGLPGQPGEPGQPPMVPLTVKDLAEEAIEIARKKAKRAETRIYDWMVECQYQPEMRKVIFDAARIGVGVLKGPFPKPSRSIATKREGKNTLEVLVEEKITPAAKWADPWNIFPDPACGENIHDGDYILERDYLSVRQLRNLKKTPGYIAAQIDKVLEEGPQNATNESEQPASTDSQRYRKGRFEVWYYYGTITREEMDEASQAGFQGKPLTTEDVPTDRKQVYAILTLVNSTVVRASINPLDSGTFPYNVVPWQRRAGHWAGIGVSEQLRVPQRMLNAATRSMLNNAGKSAGSQIVFDQSCIRAADGEPTVTPDKIWYKTGDSTGNDVRQAFVMFNIPNVTPQLMTIVEYALRLAEESTSIPLITQGQSGPTTPDTFGAAQLQNNNANQLLRSIGYAFDDYITEPLVRAFYEWLLLDPDVPDEEKGDFQIHAHGSVTLVERAIQDQTIAQMGTVVLNPAYGLNPKKWAPQFLKSKRMNPEDFKYTEEEQARLDGQPPAKAPQVQAAEVRAAADVEIATADRELDEKDILADNTVALHELSLKRELAMLDYANRRGMTLDQVKGQLAKTAMTLKTQVQLSERRPQKPAATPAAEPQGRAPAGKAFTQ